jgi:hypothetical protein
VSTVDRADFLYRAIERFADWIKFQDTKAGATLVILAVGTGDLITNASRLAHAHQFSNPGVLATFAFWAAALFASMTLIFVALTLLPKVKAKTRPSLYFFGSVASFDSADEFAAQVRTLKSHDLISHLSAQAWELARIANRKALFVRIATFAVAAFLLAWAVGRLALGLK